MAQCVAAERASALPTPDLNNALKTGEKPVGCDNRRAFFVRGKRSKRSWWFERCETAGVIASIFRLCGAWVGLGLNVHTSTSHGRAIMSAKLFWLFLEGYRLCF